MKKAIYIVFIACGLLSLRPSQARKYDININNISDYRNKPLPNKLLSGIIGTNENFINKNRNQNITAATLEHHLIDKIKYENSDTYLVFEYFSLEGLSCSIQAITLDKTGKLISIFQLAELVEYPDGQLKESSELTENLAIKTIVSSGIQEYNDSLDQLVMKIDTTILSYRLNRFEKIERIDSVFKHYEYIE